MEGEGWNNKKKNSCVSHDKFHRILDPVTGERECVCIRLFLDARYEISLGYFAGE